MKKLAHNNNNNNNNFSSAATAQRRPRTPHHCGSYITHNDTPQSVGLFWTSDRPVADSNVEFVPPNIVRHGTGRFGHSKSFTSYEFSFLCTNMTVNNETGFVTQAQLLNAG